MVVAKRQGQEKPGKIEQRRVWGPEWGPQVEQTAFLASPVYTGQARGRKKHIKRGASGPGGSLPPSHTRSLSLYLPFESFGSACPHALSEDVFSFSFLNKTDLSEIFNTDCPRAVMRFNVCRFKSLLWRDRPEEITLPWQGDGDKCSGKRCWGPAPYTNWPSDGILIVQHSPEFLFPRVILQFPWSYLRYQVSFR